MILNKGGVVLLNKPKGYSSNKALVLVKKKFGVAKAGHCGTLDPLASGLLPICLSEATKFSNLWLEADKEYIAMVYLGKITTTYDAEGDVVQESNVPVLDVPLINKYLDLFRGEIEQTPPIYSALKYNGKPMYEYARNGIEIDMSIKKRSVIIKELEILNYTAPLLQIRVLCSKGTYIRSLAYDIGQVIGCGAYMSDLIRSQTMGFTLNQSIELDQLLAEDTDNIHNYLQPIELLVQHLPVLYLSDAQIQDLHHGKIFMLENINDSDYKVVDASQIFHGIISVTDGLAKVKRFMSM